MDALQNFNIKYRENDFAPGGGGGFGVSTAESQETLSARSFRDLVASSSSMAATVSPDEPTPKQLTETHILLYFPFPDFSSYPLFDYVDYGRCSRYDPRTLRVTLEFYKCV